MITINLGNVTTSSQNSASGSMVSISGVDPDLYGGTDIWVFTNGTQQFCTGFGKFYVPLYDKNVAGFGIWASGNSYSAGDKAIWGGMCWENNNGLTGSAVDDFTLNSDWTVIPYDEVNYRVVYNPIVYDSENDLIVERSECQSGNKVITSQFINEYFVDFRNWGNPIKSFQWGNEIDFDGGVNPRGIGDTLVNGALVNNINFTGAYMFNLKLSNKSIIRLLECTGDSNINSITLDNNSGIIDATLAGASRIRNVTMLNNSAINGLTMDNASVIEMVELANQAIITDLVLDGQTITGWNVSYATVDFAGGSSVGDAFGCNITNNVIVYPIELTFDGNAGTGAVGALNMFNYAFEDGFYIDSVVTNADGLAYGVGAYITLGIGIDDVDAGLNATTGLCATIDGVITIPATALTFATASRKLVAAVGGAAITGGTCNILVTLKRA